MSTDPAAKVGRGAVGNGGKLTLLVRDEGQSNRVISTRCHIHTLVAALNNFVVLTLDCSFTNARCCVPHAVCDGQDQRIIAKAQWHRQ